MTISSTILPRQLAGMVADHEVGHVALLLLRQSHAALLRLLDNAPSSTSKIAPHLSLDQGDDLLRHGAAVQASQHHQRLPHTCGEPHVQLRIRASHAERCYHVSPPSTPNRRFVHRSNPLIPHTTTAACALRPSPNRVFSRVTTTSPTPARNLNSFTHQRGASQ